MKRGEFKGWVTGTYQQYIYEHDAYNEPVEPLRHYWNEYKWWLRSQFRNKQKQEKKREAIDERFKRWS